MLACNCSVRYCSTISIAGYCAKCTDSSEPSKAHQQQDSLQHRGSTPVLPADAS